MSTRSISVAAALAVAAAFGLADVSSAGENQTMTFREYLQSTGKSLNCYFTVESVGREGWLNNPILNRVVEGTPVSSIESLALILTNEAGSLMNSAGLSNDIQVVVDRQERSRPVIRIRDKNLGRVRTTYL